MSELAKSLQTVRDQIQQSGSCWVESPRPGKWYKTHNPKIVQDRLRLLDESIRYFKRK